MLRGKYMINDRLINFFKEKNWWYEYESEYYKKALKNLNIDMSSDFISFYLHVEDSTTFSSKNGEIYQLGWFLSNTDLMNYIFNINDILNISHNFILLNSFESESGFFFNKIDGSVISYILGEDINNPKNTWEDFNTFLIWFFDL